MKVSSGPWWPLDQLKMYPFKKVLITISLDYQSLTLGHKTLAMAGIVWFFRHPPVKRLHSVLVWRKVMAGNHPHSCCWYTRKNWRHLLLLFGLPTCFKSVVSSTTDLVCSSHNAVKTRMETTVLHCHKEHDAVLKKQLLKLKQNYNLCSRELSCSRKRVDFHHLGFCLFSICNNGKHTVQENCCLLIIINMKISSHQ